MGRHGQQQARSRAETLPPVIEKFRQQLGPSGFRWSVTALVTLVVAAVALLISSPPSSSSSTSSVSDDSLVGTTPLGCEVRGLGGIESTAPWCTQAALAKKLCNMDIGDTTPDVQDAGSATVASWRWYDSSVTSYRLTAGGSIFACTNNMDRAKLKVRNITFDASFWQQLNSVGPDTPALEYYFANGGAFG